MTTRMFLRLATGAMLVASPALAQETLTIGFTASQTGKLNNDSTAQKRGFEMWREEVNAAGGIKVAQKNYKVDFVTTTNRRIPVYSSSTLG